MPTYVTPVPEATYYGVPVTCIGEDGDMLAFGHHPARRALAAFNRHAREQLGLLNLVDSRSALAEDVLADIAHGWVHFREPNPDDDGGEDPDWEWVMDPCAETDANATAVTLYRA